MIDARVLVTAVMLFLGGCAAWNRSGSTENFNAWLDDEFEEYLDFSPLAKSRLGDKSDHDKLDDESLEMQQRILDWRRDSVAEMKERFDRAALDESARLSWDLWEYLLERAEAGRPYWHHQYIFGRRGPHTGLPRSLMSYHTVDDRADMEAYIARLNQVHRYLGQYLERAETSAEMGIRAPYFDYELAISQIERVTQGEPFDDRGVSALWRDITGKIDALEASGGIDADEAGRLRNRAREAMLTSVEPAYDEILAWLRRDLEHVSPQAKGAWALPDGEAFYDYALSAMTTLPLTADEIHELGLAEVARIQAEMRRIKDAVGFDGTLQEFFRFMREDDQFYFPNTDAGREAYLDLAREYLDNMEKKLPAFFGILPRAPLVVRRVEAFREQAGGSAHYVRGTKDGSRPGVFYVHLADMRAIAKYRLENLAYHEGLPGHHLQISIQQEREGIPGFRTYHGYTAYSEGWGLYSEYLGREMGFYDDPYSDFGRLTGEIWRAIRLVVDTGIHARGWTEQQAIEYALENSPRPVDAVRSEIRRYFNNPAQATAYKIGMLKILELRAKAKASLGEDFDIRAFHDVVLGNGALPLPLLEAQVNAWIESQT